MDGIYGQLSGPPLGNELFGNLPASSTIDFTLLPSFYSDSLKSFSSTGYSLIFNSYQGDPVVNAQSSSSPLRTLADSTVNIMFGASSLAISTSVSEKLSPSQRLSVLFSFVVSFLGALRAFFPFVLQFFGKRGERKVYKERQEAMSRVSKQLQQQQQQHCYHHKKEESAVAACFASGGSFTTSTLGGDPMPTAAVTSPVVVEVEMSSSATTL